MQILEKQNPLIPAPSDEAVGLPPKRPVRRYIAELVSLTAFVVYIGLQISDIACPAKRTSEPIDPDERPRVQVKCRNCNGTGKLGVLVCPRCGGAGKSEIGKF